MYISPSLHPNSFPLSSFSNTTSIFYLLLSDQRRHYLSYSIGSKSYQAQLGIAKILKCLGKRSLWSLTCRNLVALYSSCKSFSVSAHALLPGRSYPASTITREPQGINGLRIATCKERNQWVDGLNGHFSLASGLTGRHPSWPPSLLASLPVRTMAWF